MKHHTQIPHNLPHIPEIEERHIFGVTRSTQSHEDDNTTSNNFPNLSNNDLSPLHQNSYFDRKFEIPTNTSNPSSYFTVYESGNKNLNSVSFVFIHGAGLSALSFAYICKNIQSVSSDIADDVTKYHCVAFDLRGHGLTHISENEDANEVDESCRDLKREELWSIDNLTSDCSFVINQVFQRDINDTTEHQPYLIVLVGHSLGGSIAAKISWNFSNVDESLFQNLTFIDKSKVKIVGLVVEDVVEDTALAALPIMKSILDRRPKSFDSIKQAIKYTCDTNKARNIESCRISVPSQLIQLKNKKYVWRTNLKNSRRFQREQYIGLDTQFLECKVAKLLLLAATDRLGRRTTIAQMQGKFQLIVFGDRDSDCGHDLHEDRPIEVAKALVRFVERNKFVEFERKSKIFD